MDPSDALARWLDPEMRAFIARTNGFYPDSAIAGIAESRALYDRLCAGFRAELPTGVRAADAAVETAAGAVPVRRYHPAQAAGNAALLYLHGGGFVLGGLDSHHDVCAELSDGTGLEVWSVAYRLAPEHVYPAALEDAEAAFRALSAGGRPVVVGGDSAGGRIAAALCHRLRRRGQPQPRGQVLIYPSLSSDPLRVAGSRAATAPMLTAEECVHYNHLYAGGAGGVPEGDAEFAPLDAADFSGLAPAAIFAAGYDPLRQDAEDYAAALHAAGVSVAYRDDPGLVHGWLRARHISRLAARAFAAVVAATVALADGMVPRS